MGVLAAGSAPSREETGTLLRESEILYLNGPVESPYRDAANELHVLRNSQLAGKPTF